MLNLSHDDVLGANFIGYYEDYVERVWYYYGTGANSLELDNPAGAGVLGGRLYNNHLVIGDDAFYKLSMVDIFVCNRDL